MTALFRAKLFSVAVLIFGASMSVAQNVPPEPLMQPVPVYPEELKGKGITGRVEFEYVISPAGDVESVKIVSSPRPEFADSVKEAVSRWKFSPGIRKGKPVRVKAKSAIRFEWREDPDPLKKKGEPGATDNPDGAQRLREDH